MPEQIYIGNPPKGQVNIRESFVIDNDSFPVLFNFYTWRGRVKRKRGTIFLGQLQIQEQSVLNSTPPANYQVGQILTLDGSGNGSGSLISIFSLPSTSTVVPGSIHFSDGTNTYTEPAIPNGILVGAPAGSGTINYATGAFTIAGGAAGAVLRGAAGVVSFSYFPGNPVMGLRDFVSTVESFYPLLVAFDTTNAYQVNQAGVPFFYNVTYYKVSQNPFVWSGQDYQQFWTTNYSGALWATNSKPGLHMKTGTYVSGSGTTAIVITLAAGSPTLVVGDYLWFNEWGSNTINGQTAQVTNISGSDITVTFATTVTASGTGQVQFLTASVSGQDGIKWYDGDPTSGTGIPTATGKGWVNFAPPLTASTVSINNTPPALYYLIGALIILPFKDRLLFFNPTIGTSGGTIIQLQDTVIWSWNGTPYYASPVPTNEIFDVTAYYVDQTGKGGYLAAGISQPITTVTNNEDVLIVGFAGPRGRKTRFVFTGNDLNPFLFFNINSEMTSDSTFSAITLDKGSIDIGIYGITMTDQQSTQRTDLDIPDSVFTISNLTNGVQRVNAVRDFQKEWIYFCYPVNNSQWKYPTQTFLFNYRDNTWAVLYENFTCHGTFRYTSGYTWATLPYNNWGEWTDPWNAGIQSAQFPDIVGGTPQGYVLVKGEGTSEGASCTIYAITSANGGDATQITSFNHCVTDSNPNTEEGDFIYITGGIGFKQSSITAITRASQAVITTVNTFTAGKFVTISDVVGMTELNGNTYEIASASGTSIALNVDSSAFSAYISGGVVTSAFNGLVGKVIQVIDMNNFVINVSYPEGTYLGLGVFAKLSHPFMQTKAFNPYWDQGRQMRLSAQKYLLDATADSQVTIEIYLSQDTSTSWDTPDNDALVYTQLLYTCWESTNLGLTSANTNLQMPTGETQNQIWHRFNTSLIGDSVSVGITLSEAQMMNIDYATDEITLHGMHLTVDKGPHLA
jgi:hypothetical protein